jgi:hypothetical protein
MNHPGSPSWAVIKVRFESEQADSGSHLPSPVQLFNTVNTDRTAFLHSQSIITEPEPVVTEHKQLVCLKTAESMNLRSQSLVCLAGRESRVQNALLSGPVCTDPTWLLSS